MRICAVCPYCGAKLQSHGEAPVLGAVPLVACWRCLRFIVLVLAARQPSVEELANLEHEQLNDLRKAALAYRESIRE